MRRRAWPASGALLLAAVLAACDSEVTEPPFLPETSPSPVAGTAAPAGLESFRAFAGEIESALQARNVDFFLDVAQTSSATCPNEFEPRCQGQPPGTEVEGVWLGRWRSEGSLATPQDLGQELSAYLDSLSAPTLYAIAGLDRELVGIIGGPAFFAVVASSDDLSGTTRVFEFVSADGEWRMPLVILVPVLAEEWLSGQCAECYDQWERWEGAP